MNNDYSVLLENLMGRRYDEALRESILSDAFEECEYPDSLKYALEAMEEIDPSYAYKTFHITKRIQDKLDKVFNDINLKVDFRYQGPIQTETHIVLYGGVELIILTKPYDKKPWIKINQIAGEVMGVLTGDQNFKEIDYSSKLRIKLSTSKPKCEIKILPAVWLDNNEYLETKREIDRGICEYNMLKKTRRRYLPFLNIARINAKDNRCNGGLKRIIRLLLTLQRDSEEDIDLNWYEISSVIYAIPEKQLKFNNEYALSLLGVVSAQLNRVVTDKNYRERLLSPSEKELVFGSRHYLTDEVVKLKTELDHLIQDLNEDLRQDGDKTIYSEVKYQ
ncbi:MAG: hypothetical protein CMB80_32390 [Flammeovirgaceae bacterium]|nr:hypothetical protein [Flammeovirgaceae bacterium]HCX22919.1 hypothetical protein [Cytophagales bacterium]|tara:strand:- start:1500 stop:2501 length:1002 start_codon:yes stop_codon:yes gene_type:complete